MGKGFTVMILNYMVQTPYGSLSQTNHMPKKLLKDHKFIHFKLKGSFPHLPIKIFSQKYVDTHNNSWVQRSTLHLTE
jgi:hypothetical protein